MELRFPKRFLNPRHRSHRARGKGSRRLFSHLGHEFRLEDRRLLSTVGWDGGAGTLNWQDAANWSADVLPAPTDDVVIPDLLGEIRILITQSTVVRSINSAEGLGITSSGSLTVTSSSSQVTGELALSSGASISASTGAVFTASGAANLDGASVYATGGAVLTFPGVTS